MCSPTRAYPPPPNLLPFLPCSAVIGIRNTDTSHQVVRDSSFPDYNIAFTGTTIWRALLPLQDLTDQDPRFGVTGWWHMPTSHVYFSPVGEGLGEIASREYQDPAVHSASKVVWGVPVTNEHVESHFKVPYPSSHAASRRVASLPASSSRHYRVSPTETT